MVRRIVFLTLGVLECLAAIVLLVFASGMPGAAEVHDGVARVEDVTGQTSAQVGRLREELHALRAQRPKLREMAENLRVQMDLATKNLQGQRIDFGGVQTVGEALGNMAQGLDGLSDALNPDGVRRIADGFKGAADFLDDQVAPAAARAADQLDESTAALRSDAQELSRLLRAAPIDLKAARRIHDSLVRFTDSLDRLDVRLDADRIDSLRDGFKGVEEALAAGADEVDQASDLTYPTVRLVGLTPIVNQQPLWPDGKKIAEGLRRASRGASEAKAQLDSLGVDFPKLHESLNEGRKVAAATRDALGTALRQQDQAEVVLKDAPEHAARLADELPKLSSGLSKVLRDTKRLKEASGLLREAQKGLETTAARWPALQKTLADSARLLRATQGQMQNALDHRDDYDKAMKQTVDLARAYSAALPLMTEQLDDQLREQEDSLQNLGDSIDRTTAVLPEWDRAASRTLEITRLLLFLMGAIFGLHGTYLMVGAWGRRRGLA